MTFTCPTELLWLQDVISAQSLPTVTVRFLPPRQSETLHTETVSLQCGNHGSAKRLSSWIWKVKKITSRWLSQQPRGTPDGVFDSMIKAYIHAFFVCLFIMYASLLFWFVCFLAVVVVCGFRCLWSRDATVKRFELRQDGAL